jgi:hypothetical protein
VIASFAPQLSPAELGEGADVPAVDHGGGGHDLRHRDDAGAADARDAHGELVRGDPAPGFGQCLAGQERAEGVR